MLAVEDVVERQRVETTAHWQGHEPLWQGLVLLGRLADDCRTSRRLPQRAVLLQEVAAFCRDWGAEEE